MADGQDVQMEDAPPPEAPPAPAPKPEAEAAAEAAAAEQPAPAPAAEAPKAAEGEAAAGEQQPAAAEKEEEDKEEPEPREPLEALASADWSRWTPRDDHLLRAAVEKGAAPEALACGNPAGIAVGFSKAFGADELRRRWRALLYCRPVAQAAARAAAEAGGAAEPGEGGDGAPAAPGKTLRELWAERPDAGAHASDELPSFSDVETLVVTSEAALAAPPGPADGAARKAERVARRRRLRAVATLERTAAAAESRAATTAGVLAVLQGIKCRYAIKKPEVLIGRSTDDQKVDVDLGAEGNASKVSRQQAFLMLRPDGEFYLRNIGRRPVTVDAATVETGHRIKLAPMNLIEVGGIRLLFIPNRELAKRLAPIF